VGYISYNAFPGCHIRQMIWHMMQYHTANVEAPMAKVQNGINFLNFLVHATPDDSLYQSMIKMELAQFGQRTPENIYHDDFASINQPYYFHEFVDLLNGAGLQFLSEVDSFWMEAAEISPEVMKKLDDLGDDIVRREQYIDFIKCRPFRSTLVCHAGIELDREPGPEILKNFYLASQVEPETAEPDFTTPGTLKFAGAEGGVFEVGNPLPKAAIFHLQKIWSRSIGFEELMKEASDLAGGASAADVETTSAELLDLFKRGFIYLHRYRPDFPVEPSERPAATKFAQWQLRRNASDITTLSGMNLKPENDLMRLLLLLCDGTRDRAALVSEIAARIEFDETRKAEFMAKLPITIESKLLEFAKLGLLLP
jgi:methyltransferase-like protein